MVPAGVALITGATVGLWKRECNLFMPNTRQDAWSIYYSWSRRNGERIKMETYGAETSLEVGDVSNKESIWVRQKARRSRGSECDLLQRAGVYRLAHLKKWAMKCATSISRANKGVVNSCQAVIPYMLEQGGGSTLSRHSSQGDIVADARSSSTLWQSSARWRTKCWPWRRPPYPRELFTTWYRRTPIVEKMAINPTQTTQKVPSKTSQKCQWNAWQTHPKSASSLRLSLEATQIP